MKRVKKKPNLLFDVKVVHRLSVEQMSSIKTGKAGGDPTGSPPKKSNQ